MFRITLNGLAAHKLRLALTAIAIVLGVTFVAGTLILTDTLQHTVATLLGNVYAKVDFEVRGIPQFPTHGTGAGAVRNAIPSSLLAKVRGVPGVEAAEGQVGGYAQYLSPAGVPIANGGAPTLGVNFDPSPQLSELHLVTGTAPTSPREVAMDAATATKYHFGVGERVRILFIGQPRTFTISGIIRFGTADNLAGATIAAFWTPTAQQVFGDVGKFDDIEILTKPHATQAAVGRAIARALPRDVQVVSGATVLAEQTTATDRSISLFSTFLLVFGFIALFVGAFTIFNTFSIIVGQRTRELALLRVVGASRGQVFASVLSEAGAVGLASSLLGLGLGTLAAVGLVKLLAGFGVDLPPGPLVFEPRTVIVGLIVGVGVTVVAAIGPARRAVRIPPVAALREGQADADVSQRRRFAWGAAITTVGAAALAVGLSQPSAGFVGLGAAGLFVGVAMLAPLVARPVTSALGRPFAALLRAPGALGRENSMRNPRRTAQTASALMIGLALVSAMAVTGASLSLSTTTIVAGALRADLIVTTTSAAGPTGLSTTVPRIAAAVHGVSSSTIVYGGTFEFRGTIDTLKALSTAHLSSTVDVAVTAGSIGALGHGEMLVDASTAAADHLGVGDTMTVKFARTGWIHVRVGGIYKANALIGSYLVSEAFYLAHYTEPHPGAVLLDTGGNSGVEAAVARALAPFPTVEVQSRAQFEATEEKGVNQLLGVVYALLALAILIALIGIVNTLLLSVLERTRELGLLRAIGMTRRQVRVMVRAESVVLALFGAVVGMVVGAGLGIALVESLRTKGVGTLGVPVSSLLVFLVLAALLGLVAASIPARRAARLDILMAIATE